MLTVQSNAALVAGLLDAAVEKLPAASGRAGDAVGNLELLETTRAMEEGIYDQPLPPSYERYGLEDRSGALLAGEALITRGEHERVITTVNTGFGGKDPTVYAQARHDNNNYPAPWREEGAEAAEPKIPEVAEKALIENLPPGLVTK